MAFLLYNQDKWWYKAITCFLVLALIVMISIGVAPRAKAVGVLTFTVLAAILAVMAGAGIYTVVSGMAAGDMQSWMQGKLNQWDSYRNDGNVFTDLIDGNLITVTVKGILSIGSAAARGISDFITWLKADLSLTDNSSVRVESSSALMMLTSSYQTIAYNIDSGAIYKVKTYNSTAPIYAGWCIGGTQEGSGPLLVSEQPGQWTMTFRNLGPGLPDNEIEGQLSNYDAETQLYYSNYAWIIGEFNYINTVTNTNISNFNSNVHELLRTLRAIINTGNLGTNKSLDINAGVINIPAIPVDKDIHIDVGAYPGINFDELINSIINAILDNILTAQMALVGEFTDAIEAVIINELPISVDTDHHAFGFVPPEISFDFSSIWHYVEEAIEYSLSWISWFMGMLTAVPVLAIPLFCCFTLVVVLGAFRRFLL